MSTADRKPFVGGNWKMNTNSAGASALIGAVTDRSGSSDAEVVVYPPFVYLREVGAAMSGKGTNVRLGAQDFRHEPDGAMTGCISLSMLKDCGATSVLTGHSERRHVIGESDSLINAKTKAALDAGMQVVLCIGELLEEREAGQTDAVNERQLRAGLDGVAESQLGQVVLAYEPVWAIGTGKTATSGDAQDAHTKIRGLVESMYSADAASKMRILYGGSVKPGNAVELFGMPDIDGGLIGGASLNADDFGAIVDATGR
ncbi:MAG: triose-phosphate isomerase [Phycisphaerales bacterium]|nr:triose-phosphate isomerase [Phycisphaerales bacterium]